MRLRWGPHAAERAESVVLRDPGYVADVLASQPDSILAAIFRDLLAGFDAIALQSPCARCRGHAQGLCAYPGSLGLIGFCERCALLAQDAAPGSAVRVTTYEDALRHVVMSFPRGHRIHMRRIIAGLVLAKGGPARLTEQAVQAFFGLAPAPQCRPPRR